MQLIKHILQNKSLVNLQAKGCAFAPVNIALCKYWGKRNVELNLPITPSFSISLGSKGAYTRISFNPKMQDEFFVNGELILSDNLFAKQLQKFLDLFRLLPIVRYKVEIDINVPLAAGLASSACIYASLVQALDHMYNWQLDKTKLSILARLGSGSACRSLWKGFVEWSTGIDSNGMDSFAQPFPYIWPELRIGLYIIDNKIKPISSREAMQRTVITSKLYKLWPNKVAKDLAALKQAIIEQDFRLFAKTAESNALMMHAAMQNAVPPIIYSQPETLKIRKKIWQLRKSGIPVYFTQDAGANLKLLFLDSDTKIIREAFSELEVIAPFADPNKEQVILVDQNDKAIGIEEKLTAHRKAKLHRAFSVFILRKKNNSTEILLQQRDKNKYHCGNLWSNTCCSHPRPDEDIISAAQRRLQEEMGFTADLYHAGKIQYSAAFTNGLTENELDHILVGQIDEEKILVNKNEVQDYKWMDLSALQQDLKQNPNKYTPWLQRTLRILIT